MKKTLMWCPDRIIRKILTASFEKPLRRLTIKKHVVDLSHFEQHAVAVTQLNTTRRRSNETSQKLSSRCQTTRFRANKTLHNMSLR